MKIISKLIYQARKHGFDVTVSDGEVKLMNLINKKYVHILPNGRICSEDTLGHDKALKCLMNKFLVEDLISLPTRVTLHVGKGVLKTDINFAKCCLYQCFANIKNFNVKEDHDLLSHECKVDHEYVLSYKERQALINACLEYLN